LEPSGPVQVRNGIALLYICNVACFILGNSSASEFYMPMFRSTLFHLHRRVGVKNDWGWECWGTYMGKGCFPPQPVFVLGTAHTLSPSFRLAIFEPNPFPYKYPNIPNPSHSSYLPACKDGTDSVPKCWHITFRRQGITQKKAYNIHNMAKVLKSRIYLCLLMAFS